MVTRLVHYSAEPLVLEPRTPEQPGAEGDMLWFAKPSGLWLSVADDEDNWLAWCLSEEFGLERLRYANEVFLAPDARLLWLEGAAAIDHFTFRFGRQSQKAAALRAEFRDSQYLNKLLDERKVIDWAAVAAEYQGIVIAPYVWRRRLHDYTGWYYGWDCASGCIWDVTAIERVETISRDDGT